MLRPFKHIDLNTCILNVSSFILDKLIECGPTKYSEVIVSLQEQFGENVRFQTGPSLSFLYLLGAIDYDQTSDTIFMKESSKESSIEE